MANTIVTKEQIAKIVEINEALKGTRIYNRYYMYHSSKGTGKRYIDIGWTYVLRITDGAFLKKVKDTTFLMIPDAHFIGEYDRYEVTNAVAELFGWEV